MRDVLLILGIQVYFVHVDEGVDSGTTFELIYIGTRAERDTERKG